MSKGAQNDFSNPTADLLAAIEKLETFAEQSQSPAGISVHHLNRKEGTSLPPSDNPLEKTISSVRSFFTSVFSENTEQEQHEKKQQITEVLQAIDVVKSNFYLIQKYQEGTPEQQKIAASTIAAIEAYNQTILDEHKNSATLRHRIERFFKGNKAAEDNLPKAIDFPFPIVEHAEFPKKGDAPKRISHKFECPSAQAASLKIFSFIQQNIIPASERDTSPNDNEKAGFMMKGITMVQNLGNAFPLEDLMKTLRKAPIRAVLKKSDNRTTPDNATVSLSQTITPFPGDTMDFFGEFTRKSQCSVPISHSFRLFSKSVQTGFPHPSQHTGWALADQLIPAYPQKVEQLLLLQPLLQRKNAIAKALLPKGEMREKAKSLLKLKKQGFEADKEDLIPLLLNLHLAIIKASSSANSRELQLTVQRFFEELKQRPNAFDELSETQHVLLETFVRHPFEKLKSDWVERSIPEFLSSNLTHRYRTALFVLENEKTKRRQELLIQSQALSDGFEKKAIDFILGMGEILFNPCALIILQHFSEIIHFPPPVLGEFEQKIQLSLYSQLQDFLDGIESHNPSAASASIKKQFIGQIRTDLEIFSAKAMEESTHPLLPLIKELKGYFNEQYIAKQQLIAS